MRGVKRTTIGRLVVEARERGAVPCVLEAGGWMVRVSWLRRKPEAELAARLGQAKIAERQVAAWIGSPGVVVRIYAEVGDPPMPVTVALGRVPHGAGREETVGIVVDLMSRARQVKRKLTRRKRWWMAHGRRKVG